jgi:hypothetical protein
MQPRWLAERGGGSLATRGLPWFYEDPRTERAEAVNGDRASRSQNDN